MKFRVEKASGGESYDCEINTMDELLKLAEEYAEPMTPDKPQDVIVAFGGWGRDCPTIVIYDDYVE